MEDIIKIGSAIANGGAVASMAVIFGLFLLMVLPRMMDKMLTALQNNTEALHRLADTFPNVCPAAKVQPRIVRNEKK